MKIVIFGLSLSSSWGNGHATVWRGLLRAMAARGHDTVFFERNQPYYAPHRDLPTVPYAQLKLYPDWDQIVPDVENELRDADVAIVTSYCPDAVAATALLATRRQPLRVFYDLDTPVTLDHLRQHQHVDYLPPHGLRDYDLALSFTGGAALDALRDRLGAPNVGVLYGSVDPAIHKRVHPNERFRGDLSYLGTFAEDRQEMLAQLFIEPARRLPERRFLLGGALYPQNFPWTENIFFVHHLPPKEHAEFYSSSPLTLNVTRRSMAQMGFCPSGRLFEAAACGTAILSDWWEGLDRFFTPGQEILVAWNTDEAVAAIQQPREKLAEIGRAAQRRILAEHTAERRAEEFETILHAALASTPRLTHGTAAMHAHAGAT